MSGQIKTPQENRFARILSVGSERGNRVVTNEEMCTMIDSTPEWIEQRTGITERRWIDETQTPLSMAVGASRTALERAGITPEQVSAIVVATVSHFQQTPALACHIAFELGCPDPAAFDLSAACAGFGFGLATAETLVRGGTSEYVLVVGVEALSLMLDKSDRSTAFIFSDGAGAVVVGPSETPGMGPVVWGTDPKATDVIMTDDWTMTMPKGEFPFLKMEGRQVFRWATTFIAEKSAEAIAAAGLTPDQLDVFIPHQANNRITDSMLRHLKLPENVVVSRDICTMGNSSAASIPVAMDALLEQGQAKSGDTALVIGFGAGLSFAGQVITLP